MMFFRSIHKLLDKAIALDQGKAFIFSMDQETRDFIVSLNTHVQLGEDGIDSTGSSLGEYAPFTVEKKLEDGFGIGAITDHITFYDTGDYWASWRVELNGEVATIKVDKGKFNELVNVLGFSEDHVGLSDDNLGKLSSFMLKKYIRFARKELNL